MLLGVSRHMRNSTYYLGVAAGALNPDPLTLNLENPFLTRNRRLPGVLIAGLYFVDRGFDILGC